MRAQPTILGNPRNPTDQTRFDERQSRVLNSNVSFGSTMNNTDKDQNMNAWKATGTTPGAANTDFTIQHSLGRIPISIGAQDTTNGGVLYRSPVTPWTKNSVTLRCTAASSAYNIILI